MIAGTRIDLLFIAVVESASALGIFILLSACVVAVIFGPRDHPAVIARMAWMFTPPENALEWFGLGVAVLITLATLLLPWSMTTPLAGADYGPLGRAVLYAVYLPMATWVAYLVRVYVRRQ